VMLERARSAPPQSGRGRRSHGPTGAGIHGLAEEASELDGG
jgi:hypothetical protein